MNIKTAIIILFGLSVLFMIAPGSNRACAQVTPPAAGGAAIAEQTCDTQVWRTMADRAKLETEREIMQNQNLIFKADSILNYTCFDSFAAHAAQNIGPLFTHTTYFGGQMIIGWGDSTPGPGMDRAMRNVVTDSMKTYIDSNFDHSFLGGRGEFLDLATPPGVTDVPNAGAPYACEVMSQVWKVAKCLNFMHTNEFVNTDGYYPFIDLTGIEGDDIRGYSTLEDIRAYPISYACDGEAFFGSTWTDVYRNSRNESGADGTNDFYYQYGTPLRDTFQAVRLLTDPDATECGAAIPTGIMVILGVGTSVDNAYMDGICTTPGCSYVRGSNTTVGTCTRDRPAAGSGAAAG